MYATNSEYDDTTYNTTQHASIASLTVFHKKKAPSIASLVSYRNAVRVRVRQKFRAAVELPFPPRRDDFHIRFESVIPELESHLVVPFARGAVAHRIGAHHICDFNLSAGGERRTSERARGKRVSVHPRWVRIIMSGVCCLPRHRFSIPCEGCKRASSILETRARVTNKDKGAHLTLGDERSRDARAQQIRAFVQRVGAEHGEDVIAHKFFS